MSIILTSFFGILINYVVFSQLIQISLNRCIRLQLYRLLLLGLAVSTHYDTYVLPLLSLHFQTSVSSISSLVAFFISFSISVLEVDRHLTYVSVHTIKLCLISSVSVEFAFLTGPIRFQGISYRCLLTCSMSFLLIVFPVYLSSILADRLNA